MPGSSGSHGSFLGFHEDMVREDLVRILSKQSNVVVVEKLHPSEQTKHPPKGMEACWHTVEGKEPVDPLLWYADVIVGMCSKTLLEAAMFGRRPISYQPNATNTNKCTAARLGVAELVTQFDALQARLPLLLQKRQPDSVQTPPFPFATSEAPAKILQLATL
jgi:predicted glycosyltransferase